MFVAGSIQSRQFIVKHHLLFSFFIFSNVCIKLIDNNRNQPQSNCNMYCGLQLHQYNFEIIFKL